MNQLFSSEQCSDPKSSKPLPYELCYPSFESIVQQIERNIKETQNKDKIEIIYIATDNNNQTLWHLIHKRFSEMTLICPTITISSSGVMTDHKPPDLITDIYLLSYSNQFIGNCISSFSAFVSRYRKYNLNFKQMTHFFSEQKLYENSNFNIKDEL